MADIGHSEELSADVAPAESATQEPERDSTLHQSAEERGEVEQTQAEAPQVAPVEAHTNGVTGDSEDQAHQQQTEAEQPQTYTLPIRNKQSEHTEKTVSAVEEDPATLEAGGVIEQNNETTLKDQSAAAPSTTAESAATNGVPAQAAEDSHDPNGMTPARSPRVPAYLQSTAASASKKSPKPPSLRGAPGKTPMSTSKLTDSLRKASGSKPPAAQGSPAPAQPRAKSPVRTAHLSHLTAPTAASAAHKATAPAPAAKPLGRAMSVRSKKPVEGSHFLAPTASSVSRKDQPHTASSTSGSLNRTMSKRSSINTAAAPPPARKVSANTARSSLPPDNAAARPATSSRVTSSGSNGKAPATGSFLDRMTRPTAASARKTHEKLDGVKSPPPTKGSGSLGRAASVRSKINGATGTAGKKQSGLRGQSEQSVEDKKKEGENASPAPLEAVSER